MATAAPLEEHITCSVCLEIYTKPYALKCLHTYCFQCIQNLRQRDNVQCPDCRERTHIHDIKREFKIQNIVDLHEKFTKETPGEKTVCDICKKSRKVVQSFCEECQDLMCTDCDTAHRGSKLSSNHQLISLEDFVKSKQREVAKEIQKLKNGKSTIDRFQISNKGLIKKISSTMVQQIADINKIREDIKTQVEIHHNKLIHRVESINFNILEALEQDGQVIQKEESKLNHKISFLSDVSRTQDLPLLIEILQNLSENIDKETAEILHSLPEPQSHASSPVTVEKGEGFQMATTITVTPQEKLNKEKSKQIHQRYEEVKCVAIHAFPSKLSVHKGELWVGGLDKGIYVYNFNLEQEKRIGHWRFSLVTSVVKTPSEHIIVCDSKTGLHHLNQQGVYVNLICSGSFSDVSFRNDKLYALEYQACAIYMLRRTETTWVKESQFKLHYKNCSDDDKLCTSRTCLYLSSCRNNCLSVYSFTGKFLYQTGEYGARDVGKFNRPVLCDVDNDGNALVCDTSNGGLQMFCAETGDWKEVTLPEGLIEPMCAGIGNKNIWVGTLSNKLLKYDKN